MKKIKRLILGLGMMLAIAAPALVVSGGTVAAQTCTNSATAQVDSCLRAGACLDTSSASCGDDSTAVGRVNDLLKTIINIFSIIGGITAVIMIIIGGLRYILSGGDSGNITSAKNTILYAIIGLVIVALAQFIVRFVLVKVSPNF